jgi:hypothetical protein
MEGVINASDTGPDARLFHAAVSVYTAWCHEHTLAPVSAARLKVDTDKRTYALYDAQGGTLAVGAVDDLGPALGL